MTQVLTNCCDLAVFVLQIWHNRANPKLRSFMQPQCRLQRVGNCRSMKTTRNVAYSIVKIVRSIFGRCSLCGFSHVGDRPLCGCLTLFVMIETIEAAPKEGDR